MAKVGRPSNHDLVLAIVWNEISNQIYNYRLIRTMACALPRIRIKIMRRSQGIDLSKACKAVLKKGGITYKVKADEITINKFETLRSLYYKADKLRHDAVNHTQLHQKTKVLAARLDYVSAMLNLEKTETTRSKLLNKRARGRPPKLTQDGRRVKVVKKKQSQIVIPPLNW